MKHARTLGLALLAVFAFSAIAATAAQAIEGPFYKVGNVRAFGFREIKSSGGKFTLTAGTIKVVCQKQTTEAGGTIKESTIGNSGTSAEKVKFSECVVEGDGAGCKLKGSSITTEEVKNTLDYPKEIPAAGDVILVVFTPASGSVFVKLEFETKCTVGGVGEPVAVEGSVGAEALNGKSEAVKIGSEGKEEAKGFVSFPVKGTKHCTEAGKKITCKTLSLKAFGKASKLEGKSEITLPLKEEKEQVWGVFTA